METHAHARLKTIAQVFLHRLGFTAIAAEVMCPLNRYRFDVAGHIDRSPLAPGADPPEDDSVQRALFEPPAARQKIPPRSVVIECKQERSDFLRERHDLDRLIARREKLDAMRRRFEVNHLCEAEPGLREGGTSLFRELETWDFGSSRNGQYQRLLRRIDLTDSAIHHGVKLSRMARYRLADRMYVLAPTGSVAVRELPEGWGLLEVPGGVIDAVRSPLGELAEQVRVVRRARVMESPPKFRNRLLRNIAAASTREAVGRLRM